MSFRELNIKLEYRTFIDKVASDFYIPVLSQATIYKRAVGFFSSTIFIQISKGLCSMAERHAKIQLIISPELNKEDYDAIEKGYSEREMATNRILKSFDKDFTSEEKTRLALLSYLISSGVMDIKVAVVNKNNCGMFHEKLGIVEDEQGNVITFSGSSNETINGINNNYEAIDVFCGWKNNDLETRCTMKEAAFNNMWDSNIDGLTIFDFPDVIRKKMLCFESNDTNSLLNLDKELVNKIMNGSLNKTIPDDTKINYHRYQKEAIDNWVHSNYRGIFDMATGTGKTFTGFGALCKLISDKKRIVAIIVCPYVHLVEQWKEEAISNFGFEPIVGYSGSHDWEKRFKREMNKFEIRRTDFVCLITTNISFSMPRIQEMIKANINDTLLLVDEAHNFGAMKISQCLELDYPYRLALSATINRHGDEVGTKKLFDFFGSKCIEFTLQQAIKENYLTPYFYYPVLVNLQEDELEMYCDLTAKIKKYHYVNGNGEMPEGLKRLLLARARLVAGAKNKINLLSSLLKSHGNEGNILIYCGAVKYGQDGYNSALEDKRQINAVLEMIHTNYGSKISASKFTAEENAEQRETIKHAFISGEIKALVAIKCLDEGMNIPAIRTAFILASSTNPKEYIQRRGRVLRKFPGKKYAEIYDFITISRPLNEVQYTLNKDKELESGLAKRELARMNDFANLSSNPASCNEIRDEIVNAYGLNIINREDDYE